MFLWLRYLILNIIKIKNERIGVLLDTMMLQSLSLLIKLSVNLLTKYYIIYSNCQTLWSLHPGSIKQPRVV